MTRLVIVLAGLLATSAGSTQTGTVVRGRLERRVAGRPYPAANLSVTLRDSASARPRKPVYSGRDGMYYLLDVPAGTYFLEVRLTASQPALPTQPKVRVVGPPRPYTDVPPYQVP